jgi:hypothetical protein
MHCDGDRSTINFCPTVNHDVVFADHHLRQGGHVMAPFAGADGERVDHG